MLSFTGNAEVYLEIFQTSTVEHFAKIVHSISTVIFFLKVSIILIPKIHLYNGKKIDRLSDRLSTTSPTLFNLFYTTGLFLYPLKTSEGVCFSNAFRDYRKRPLV